MNYLIIILASWRISHMIAWEDGVFDINRNIRKLLRVKKFFKYDKEYLYNSKQQYILYKAEAPPHLQDNFITRGIKCTYCVSFWITLFLYTASLTTYGNIVLAFLMPVALSSLVILFNKYAT